MDNEEIRLRIVEVVVPQATRVGMMNPQNIQDTCSHLENYVIGSASQGDEPKTSGGDRPAPPSKSKKQNGPRMG